MNCENKIQRQWVTLFGLWRFKGVSIKYLLTYYKLHKSVKITKIEIINVSTFPTASSAAFSALFAATTTTSFVDQIFVWPKSSNLSRSLG